MPINPTPAQIQASRANGARSTGPTTQDGKNQSSQNATSHGLRADRLQLSEEERWIVDQLRHNLAARLMPADEAERAVLEALVICEIKLGRLDVLEMQALQVDLDEGDGPRRRPSLSTLDRYRGRIMRERRELEGRLEVLQQTRSQFTGSKAMQPQALRFLADLAERKAAAAKAGAANDDSCTNEPEDREKPQTAAAGAFVRQSPTTI